jgi:hypothetical protein
VHDLNAIAEEYAEAWDERCNAGLFAGTSGRTGT